jgi:hypothetical protein
MSTEINTVAGEIFEKIRSRFSPVTLGNDKGKDTQDPEQARFFNFTYVDDQGNKYGNVLISIIDEKTLTVTFGSDITSNMDREQRKQWYGFLRSMSKFTQRHPNMVFTVKNINKPGMTTRDVKQQAKADDAVTADEVNLAESRLQGIPGRPRQSVGEHGAVKLKIYHTDPVMDEVRGSRSRKIESIFLETPAGERFKCEHNSLHGAHALAEHLCNGGTMYDEIAECINGMIGEMSSMKHFVRSVKNRQFEDAETSNMAHAAIKHYLGLQDTLKRIGHRKYYQQFLENYSPADYSDDSIDVDALRERFVKKVYDDRFTEALPIVYREYQRQQNNYGTELEEWANTIVEEIEDESEKLQALQQHCKQPWLAGLNGIDAQSDLQEIINGLPGADELLDEIAELANTTQGQGSDADVRPLVKSWAQRNMPNWANQLSYGEENVDNASTNWKPQVSPAQSSPHDQYGSTSLDDQPMDPNIPTAMQEESDPLEFLKRLSGLIK